jgi:hypothetical protein
MDRDCKQRKKIRQDLPRTRRRANKSSVRVEWTGFRVLLVVGSRKNWIVGLGTTTNQS